LKQVVSQMALGDDGKVILGIYQVDGPSVRPTDVLKGVFGLTSEEAARVRVCKTDVTPLSGMERQRCFGN
jgi:hypothetical protein